MVKALFLLRFLFVVMLVMLIGLLFGRGELMRDKVMSCREASALRFCLFSFLQAQLGSLRILKMARQNFSLFLGLPNLGLELSPEPGARGKIACLKCGGQFELYWGK